MRILHFPFPVLLAALLFCACTQQKNDIYSSAVPQSVRDEVVSSIMDNYADGMSEDLVCRGVEQAAGFWRASDGTAEEFAAFARENYAYGSEARKALFDKLSNAMEVFNGSFDYAEVGVTLPVYLDEGELTAADEMIGAYSPDAHFTDDMFASRIAFLTILNFPCWTLEEKNTLGQEWSRLEWAYARLGDVFSERIPGEVNMKVHDAVSASENYIAQYNIKMGHLLTEDGRRIFPEDMSLLSHWNLRDELKADYADVPDANEKQEMIYKVMERIACQEIPQIVINDDSYDWNPYSNTVFKNGEAISAEREPDTRYETILNVFRAYLEEDVYCPSAPTAIQRSFDSSREISPEEIENLFIDFVSSPQVAAVASVIRERLGRELRPYDIWYDGFKSRSVIPEDKLTAQTRTLYPDTEAFHKDTPRLLKNLGFSDEIAELISSNVVVEAARGSGHAWPSRSTDRPARLRTRIGAEGMDYKGFNIAVHEFGHNSEEVLDMYMIDHYMLNGVPNEAFTEAMAFLFQSRDLQLLGYGKQTMDDAAVLDNFWGMYEIMGVSLVDMYMWRWLYDHKDATAAQLRERTVEIAHEVWNKYYEPVLGTHDSPVLAIYSHMVNAPMYLPNYPLGHLIHFQIEQHLAQYGNPRDFADELVRIYTIGRVTPEEWMRRALGSPISTRPVLEAVDKALEKL